MKNFNGIGSHIGNLYRLSDAKSRSVSPENYTGEKGKGAMAKEGFSAGCARDLGPGWKINPYHRLRPGETLTMADIEGPGCIQQIWCTFGGIPRFSILRIYWDDMEYPSVETPVGDFFANGWNWYGQLSSLAVCLNPGSGHNCYWQMPFRKRCRITLENIADKDFTIYYQVNYCLTEVPEDAAYFHAQFRRTNPLPYKDVYTILNTIKGKGHYVGTYMAWGLNNNGWWGEGEIKFYMDGDTDYPTICGTGTEDYFCGSYDYDNPHTGQYQDFTSPYSGVHQLIKPDGHYRANTRFGMYRWHITDPIRFEEDLKVTMQALGWRDGGRYNPLQDDIASVAYWYQTLPGQKLEPLPSKDGLEII